MSILRTDAQTGYMHAGAEELDRQLREGDGMLWPGDPRLELRMGIVTANKRAYVAKLKRTVNKGEVVARSYEVWRHNEDGTDSMVNRWQLHDFDRILFDLAPMRLDSPGHVDTNDAIDKHNDAIEAKISRDFRDSMGEMLEHAHSLNHDRNNPKNVFRQMPGLRDEPKPDDAGQ